MPGNYVAAMEAHGLRVVSLPYNRPFEELRPLLDKLSGVVFVGGGTNMDHYVRSRKIYNYAKHLNI